MELIGNENKIESKSDTHKNLIVIDNFFYNYQVSVNILIQLSTNW